MSINFKKEWKVAFSSCIYFQYGQRVRHDWVNELNWTDGLVTGYT